MTYKIISPEQFKTLLWKNGKGKTVELAINEGATLSDFDWRISMADVSQDGEFSNFNGYLRNLVLIKGAAITLEHDQQATDFLHQYLDFATFDGGNKTFGRLPNGSITDFNIITRSSKFDVEVFTAVQPAIKEIPSCDLLFVYALSAQVMISSSSFDKDICLSTHHLLQLKRDDSLIDLKVSGQEVVIVCLSDKEQR